MVGDLRLALRQLAKAPGFTLVVALTFALGIGATTAIFTLVNAVLLRPLPYPEPDRIVTLWSSSTHPDAIGRSDNRYKLSGPDFLDWRVQSRSFLHMALYDGGDAGVVVGGIAENVGAFAVSDGFFQALGLQPRVGRLWSAEETRAGNVAVVADSFVRRHFGGDPARALGSRIKVANRNVHIIGVLPSGRPFPAGTEIWGPFDTGVLSGTARSAHNYRVIARLQPGVSVQQAQAEMDGIAGRLAQAYPGSNRYKGAKLLPLHQLVVGGVQSTLWLLFGAVGLVLLIACANIANLLLARGVGRQHEVAVRAALGARWSRLARQFLCESLVLVTLGGALGLLAALWTTDTLLALAPADIPRLDEVSLDRRALMFSGGVSLLACVFISLFPIVQAMRHDVGTALRASGRGLTGPRGRLRAGLVVAQLALSLVLLTGAGLLLRSFHRLTEVELGYQTDRVLVMTGTYTGSGDDRHQRAVAFFEELRGRAAALPGVSSVSYGGALPIDEVGSWGSYSIEGVAPLPPGQGARRRAAWRLVGPGYFATLGVPVRAGRTIDQRDTAQAPATVVINESMARASWPGADPLGRRIRIGWDQNDLWMTIVGVVGDTKQGSPETPIDQELYVPAAQHPGLATRMKLFARTTLDPLALAEGFRQAARQLDPEVPVKLTTAERMLAETLSAPQFRSLLVGLFAGVALLLALIGVAGVMAWMVAERHTEIGIRMAIGARATNILRQFLGRSLRLVLLGLALGLAGALAAAHTLQDLLYQTSATDPLTLAAVSALLAAATLAACLVPALRAARVSPMTALRQD